MISLRHVLQFWCGVVCIAATSAQLAAQEKSWPIDPVIPGQVISQAASSDLTSFELSVVDSVTGVVDHISYHRGTGDWLAIGEDGLVLGGRLARDPLADPVIQCAGPAVILCIGGGAALICEIRRNLAVRRAQQQCNATGRGLSIRSQTGCASVRTECIPRFEAAYLEP